MFGIIESEQRFFKLVCESPLLIQSDSMHITIIMYTYRFLLQVDLGCYVHSQYERQY